MSAFVRDDSPDAYERLISRLLASPHFGERYGRYWLDLARFAETSGYERDQEKPGAWKYRDWVVRAFNEDKPYDRFVREQLAGDELPDRDLQTVTPRASCGWAPGMTSRTIRKITSMNGSRTWFT